MEDTEFDDALSPKLVILRLFLEDSEESLRKLEQRKKMLYIIKPEYILE